MKAHLVLADGSIWVGESFGADGETAGEVVFTTGMTGYQEVITDPSFRGQLVTMTCPHIGNVGVNPDDAESTHPQLAGFIVRDYCPVPSNWRSRAPLHHYLRQHGIVAIEGIDTRALTRRLRDTGAMPGIIVTGDVDLAAVAARAAALPSMAGQELVSSVSTAQSYEWTTKVWKKPLHTGVCSTPTDAKLKVVVYDFGLKQNILRNLVSAGFSVDVVPAATTAEQVLARRPAGVLLSNGPGDPAAVEYVLPEIRALLGKIPIFGICLGHQLLALSVGAKTFKLKFGHRGMNQPVLDVATGQVVITSQNHGFAVDGDSLPADMQVTHWNLNDRTIEGIASPERSCMAVQYHPEASPGPHDAAPLFARFKQMCEDYAEAH